MMLTQQMRVVQQQEAPLCVNDAGDAANAGGAATGGTALVTQQMRVVQQQEAVICVNDAGDAANAGGAATGGTTLCE